MVNTNKLPFYMLHLLIVYISPIHTAHNCCFSRWHPSPSPFLSSHHQFLSSTFFNKQIHTAPCGKTCIINCSEFGLLWGKRWRCLLGCDVEFWFQQVLLMMAFCCSHHWECNVLPWYQHHLHGALLYPSWIPSGSIATAAFMKQNKKNFLQQKSATPTPPPLCLMNLTTNYH